MNKTGGSWTGCCCYWIGLVLTRSSGPQQHCAATRATGAERLRDVEIVRVGILTGVVVWRWLSVVVGKKEYLTITEWSRLK